MKKGRGLVTNERGKKQKLSLHSLVKEGQKNVRISPVTIPDRATLTCEHSALMELAGRQ